MCGQITTLTVSVPCYVPQPHALPKLTHLNLSLEVSRDFPVTNSDDEGSDYDDPEMVEDEQTIKVWSTH